MRALLSLLITLALSLFGPASAGAQFIPIGEAKRLGSLNEQRDLERAFSQMTRKAASANRQIQLVFTEMANRKIGATDGQTKIDALVSDLKAELNVILANYARTSPPPASQREALRVAQNTLDDIRTRSEDEIERVRLEKRANPTQLTGKYITYQQKILPLIDKALAKADERLAERGTKESVRRDLEKLVGDTQRQLEIAAATFTVGNPELLESAIRRINKDALDKFSEAMAERFKEADKRGSDKRLDLTEEELAIIETEKKEAEALVERTLNTVDGMLRQIASSNIPTQSQEPGVNPLLQAKYKAVRKLGEIRSSAVSRLASIEKQFNQRTDVSQLAKDIFKQELTRQRSRLTDGLKEYETYFSAGDPPREVYIRELKRAEEKAKGTGGIFGFLGNLIGGVGSALIGKATGGLIGIPPQTISSLIGVEQPHYVPGLARPYNVNPTVLPSLGGAAVAGIQPNQSVPYYNPYDPRCQGIGRLPLVQKVYAQAEIIKEPISDGNALPQGGGQQGGSSGGTSPNDLQSLFGSAPTRNNQGTSGGGGSNRRGGGNFFSGLLPYLAPVFGNLFGGGGGGGFATPFGGGFTGFGNASRFGSSIPWWCYGMNTPSPYTAPFGGYPMANYLGLPGGSNFGFNLPSNYGSALGAMAPAFSRLGQQNPAFGLLGQYLGDNNLNYGELARLYQQPGFSRPLPADGFWRQPIPDLVRQICLRAALEFNSDTQLRDWCRQILSPTQAGYQSYGGTPPIIPGGTNFPFGAANPIAGGYSPGQANLPAGSVTLPGLPGANIPPQCPTIQEPGKMVCIITTTPNNQFSPQAVSVRDGTTVRWIDRYGATHTITAQGRTGSTFRFGGNLPNNTVEIRLERQHSPFSYYCEVHGAGMSGLIYVL